MTLIRETRFRDNYSLCSVSFFISVGVSRHRAEEEWTIGTGDHIYCILSCMWGKGKMASLKYTVSFHVKNSGKNAKHVFKYYAKLYGVISAKSLWAFEFATGNADFH